MAQDIQTAIREIQLLEFLPEAERTEYYDSVVAPLIEEFAASVQPSDLQSVSQWLQIQSSALDWAVEGVSEVTYELHQRAPQMVESALSLLPPEQHVRVQWLLNEFHGQENLPREIVERDEASSENFLRLAEDTLRDAPSAETGIFGRFVGTDTFNSSRGFPVVRGTFTLLTPDGGEAGVYASNSGGGARNYRMRNGPLPPGLYRVSHHRPNRSTAGMVHAGVGYSFDLDPADGTQVFGRSLFRIHPDVNPLGTNGCIGVREDAARLRECENNIVSLLRRVGAFNILIRY